MMTGRFRFRRGWLGRQILQVEVVEREYIAPMGWTGFYVRRWKNADAAEGYEILTRSGGKVPIEEKPDRA